MDRTSYEELQRQLEEARELIRALRQGEVDAFVSERTARLEETNRRLEAAMTELRAAQVRALDTERVTALAALAAAVAHEVNSPLMGVMNAVGYVRRHEAATELKEALKDAEEGLRLISDITRNLLTFSHSRAGTQAEVNIGAVIDRTLGFLQADLESRGIGVSRRVPTGLPPVVGGGVQVQQVISNLITNARDALEESAEKKIEIQAGVAGEEMKVKVCDTGPGIPVALQQRLFEPFYTTKPGRGTGLGLPVSRGIVKDLGGALTVQSEPGHGARFSVTLQLSGATEPRSQ